MSKKHSKMAQKLEQGNGGHVATVHTSLSKARKRKSAPSIEVKTISTTVSLTTRKTIEVPEDYFRRVKIRAVERGILEKQLWAEILAEYFKKHPNT